MESWRRCGLRFSGVLDGHGVGFWLRGFRFLIGALRLALVAGSWNAVYMWFMIPMVFWFSLWPGLCRIYGLNVGMILWFGLCVYLCLFL
jgi:hypothetical protein